MTSLSLAGETANYAEYLKIIVGSRQEIYIVHKEFILPHSPVLTEQYKKCCEFSETNTIEIPDFSDYESMRVLVNWCYRPDTALAQPEVDPDTSGDKANNKRRMQLLEVYALARDFRMVRLKNHIINQFREHSEPRVMTIALINHSANLKEPECGLVRYIVDNIARYMNKHPKRYHEQQSAWSRQLKTMLRADPALLQLVHDAQMRLAAEKVSPKHKPLCFYHDHREEDECPDAEPSSADENTEDESMDDEPLANTSRKKR